MGLGDEIMALGRCEALYEQTGVPVAILDRNSQPRNHPAWHGNPAWKYESIAAIKDGAGVRPYIKDWHGNRIVFEHTHRPRAGRIYLDAKDDALGIALRDRLGDYIVLQPNTKATASPNKHYPFQWWQEIANAAPMPVVQLLAEDDEQKLDGVTHVRTAHFRLAAAAIKHARLVVCSEGGSHHMAASMGTPAVVYFGSFVPPEVTGYPTHRNLAVATASGACGEYRVCRHCENSLGKCPPDVILSHMRDVLGGGLNAENSICWL